MYSNHRPPGYEPDELFVFLSRVYWFKLVPLDSKTEGPDTMLWQLARLQPVLVSHREAAQGPLRELRPLAGQLVFFITVAGHLALTGFPCQALQRI